MGPDAALNVEVAAVVVVAVLIVAVAVFAWACDGDAGTGVRVDVERALGEGTLIMKYEQAAKKASLLPTPPPEEEQCCAICLSKYAKAELVRVVAACGHFFHAECGVDRWLRTRRTCPVCRGGLRPPLPRLPLASRAAVAVAVV